MWLDSMWPLLKKDGLAIPYIFLTFLWNYLLGYNPFRKTTQRRLLRLLTLVSINSSTLSIDLCLRLTKYKLKKIQLIYTTILTLHVTELLIPPPRRPHTLHFAATAGLASREAF